MIELLSRHPDVLEEPKGPVIELPTEVGTGERTRYEDLVTLCNMGLTHLTAELLKHRSLFEKSFSEAYAMSKRELAAKLSEVTVHERSVIQSCLRLPSREFSIRMSLHRKAQKWEISGICFNDSRQQENV